MSEVRNPSVESLSIYLQWFGDVAHNYVIVFSERQNSKKIFAGAHSDQHRHICTILNNTVLFQSVLMSPLLPLY